MKKSIFAMILTICFLLAGCSLSGGEKSPTSHIEDVSSGREKHSADYNGDGSDLLTARQLSTGKIVLITVDGDIVAEIPSNADNIGEGMIFIPGKGAVTYQGDLVFELDCEWMGEFSDGLAQFGFQTQEGSRSGYVDTNGTVVIEPAFWGTTPFSQGYAAVMISETEWAYIDTGGTIIYRGFADAKPFSEGLAAVSPDKEKYGYITLDGEYIIEPIYQAACPFSEGLAAAAPMTDDLENRKFGYIDTTGKFVLDPIYGTAGEFWDGVAGVTFGGLRDTEYHLISMSGDEVLKNAFDWVYPVEEGVFAARRTEERESCFMSITGEKILADFSPDMF